MSLASSQRSAPYANPFARDLILRLQVARDLLARGVAGGTFPHAALAMANHGTMFGDDELKWPSRHGFRVGTALVRSLASGLVREVGYTLARMAGRYDVASLRM
jgi:hypothetical protein